MKNLINNSVQNQLFDAMQTLEKTSETLPHTRDAKQLLTDLFTAYYSARKNKRRKNSQIQFEKNYEENIIILWEQIENRTYSPKPSTVFIKTKPVIREVFAANFQDRIIHHYLFNVLSPIFEKDFIKDSYSCRKGKGTLYGINRVQGFLKEMHHSRSNAYIKPFVKYVENRTKKNIFKLVYTINNNIDDLKNENFSKETLEKIRQQLNSYLGIMHHHNSYLLRKKIFHSLHSEFWKYFWYRSDYSAVGIR